MSFKRNEIQDPAGYWWYSDYIIDVNYFYTKWKWYYPGHYISKRLKVFKKTIDDVVNYLIEKNYIIPGANIEKYNENKFIILKSHFVKLLKGKVKLDEILKLLLLQYLCFNNKVNDNIPEDDYKYLNNLFDKSEKFHWDYITSRKYEKGDFKESFLENHSYPDWSRLEKKKKVLKKQARQLYYDYRTQYKKFIKENYEKGIHQILTAEFEDFIQPYIISIFYKAISNIEKEKDINVINNHIDELKHIIFDKNNQNGLQILLPKIFDVQKNISDFYSSTIHNSIVNEYKEKNQLDLMDSLLD